MKNNLFLAFAVLIAAAGFVFAENGREKIVQSKDYTAEIKTIQRADYRVEIKQYNKNYPVVIYIVFGNEIPDLSEVKNLLYKELKIAAKKEGIANNVIASAWYDDATSDTLTKIELSDNSSAFVWLSKDKKILSFSEYLNFLKKQKKDKKNKDSSGQK